MEMDARSLKKNVTKRDHYLTTLTRESNKVNEQFSFKNLIIMRFQFKENHIQSHRLFLFKMIFKQINN